MMKFIVFIGILALANAQINIKNDIGRIVGGSEAKIKQFPYQVGMLVNAGFQQQFCGGSLISDRWILTAAHCLEDADSALIVLGAHNVLEDINAQRIYVNKHSFIKHSNWDANGLQNDIALIRLPEEVQLNENIQTISLPSKSLEKIDLVGKQMVASGWGKPADKAPTISPVLRFVKVPVIAQWRCNVRYLFQIKDTNICTKSTGGKGTCGGDSGGPLVYETPDGKKTLVGITSFGLRFGCEIGWPSVFTRVTSYLDWISHHTGIPVQ